MHSAIAGLWLETSVSQFCTPKLKDMNSSLDVTDCAELLRVTRNGEVESRHLGIAVVLDAEGKTLQSLGNPDAHIFPRSALKPFQAIGSLRSGAQLEGQALALACASHLGTFRHQELAAQILVSVGLSEADLQCPAGWPGDSLTRNKMNLAGQTKNKLAFNCSGKHAGFLAAAVALDEPTDSYLNPQHQVQRAALEATEEFCGPLSFVGVDGCGAPAPQMSLSSLAQGFRRLVISPDPEAQKIVSAWREHSWAVRGPGSPNTIVTERTSILAKLGAEGVLAMVAPSGVSVALKILDGSSRGSDMLALNLLAAHGALSSEELQDLGGTLTSTPQSEGARAAGLQFAGTDFAIA